VIMFMAGVSDVPFEGGSSSLSAVGNIVDCGNAAYLVVDLWLVDSALGIHWPAPAPSR